MRTNTYTPGVAILDAALLAFFLVMAGLLSYAGVMSAKIQSEQNPSTDRALRDPGFKAAMAEAGYRVEGRSDGWGFRWIEARCARADAKGPLPCDPAPRPPGEAGQAMKVVP